MRPIDADRFECIAYRGVPEGYSDSFDGGVLYMADLIDEAPTVSPDEVRGVGKWVRISGFHLDHEYYPSRYKCDQCGHFVNSGYDRSYCPNCGAKMEVEGDA